MSGHYKVVDRLLGDRRLGRDYLDSIRLRYGEAAVQLPLFQGMSRMFLLLDPPVHTQLRGRMAQAFGARQMDAMHEVARATAAGLIETFQSSGQCDLLKEFAFPLPRIIVRWRHPPLPGQSAGLDRHGSCASHLACNHAHRKTSLVLVRLPSRDLTRHGCRVRAYKDVLAACPATVGGQGPCSQPADHPL